jgi:hypothetical protein
VSRLEIEFSCKMYAIVEVQGYSTSECGFLPKEVYITCADGEHHFIILPPKPLQDFTEKDQKVITWNTRKYHNIPWAYGNVTMADFLVSINRLCKSFTTILSKGREKATYLSRILNRTVIDLSDYGFPSIRSSENKIKSCSAHYPPTAHCAVSSAVLLRDFLNGQRNIEALFRGNKSADIQ